jgi:Flp pilus assembly protein TadG
MMKKTLNTKGQRGAAAIEFAIVLPLLVLLVFGIIEFSFLLYDKSVITNASREGARSGIVFQDPRLDDGGIAAVVNGYCQNHLITFGDATGANTVVLRGGSGSSGDPLTVTVGYQYDFLVLPNFLTGLAGGINLTAETVMRME